jgi:hypothetical protein
MDAGTLIGGLGLAASLIAGWVNLNGRIVRLETKADHVDRQFDQIVQQLTRIELKLDGKQDRHHRHDIP